MGTTSLRRQIRGIAQDAGAEEVGVAYVDYETRAAWSYHGDRWFHAASTIKLPVLVAVFQAAEEGRFSLESRLHVRNRFISLADGRPFRVDSGRDANAAVHKSIGRTMKLRELARHMIVTSSNLATNLLVDVVGSDEIRHILKELGCDGIDFRRGVEDEKAWEAGINNRVTAAGLLAILCRIAERRAVSAQASEAMLEILHAQEFNSGIPAGVPDGARVAHKTGETSTVAHDAGLVYLPDREPYALVVLTEWDPSAGGRSEPIAAIAAAVNDHLTGGGDGDG